MKVSDINTLVKLTNIEISKEEYSKFESSVKNIIKFCGVLEEVDVDAVTPIFVVLDLSGEGLDNMREDIVTDGNYAEDLLSNVPDKEDVFISIPKVIE